MKRTDKKTIKKNKSDGTGKLNKVHNTVIVWVMSRIIKYHQLLVKARRMSVAEWTGSFYRDNLIFKVFLIRTVFVLVSFLLFHLTTLSHVIKRKTKQNTTLFCLFYFVISLGDSQNASGYSLGSLCYNNNKTRSWYESTVLWELSKVFLTIESLNGLGWKGP